jgi:hypothetical protein
MRHRNAMLEALELLRAVNGDFTVSQLVSLLYIADEAEPLPLPDLRRRAGMATDACWKTVQALTEMDDGSGEGLVRVDRWAMRGIVAAELTPAGRRLCTGLDEILAEARPILAPSGRGDGRELALEEGQRRFHAVLEVGLGPAGPVA